MAILSGKDSNLDRQHWENGIWSWQIWRQHRSEKSSGH